MAYVYRHIRLDKNEPFYIGVGSSANYNRAYTSENRNKHWNNIVNITGYEVEILFDNLSDDEARSKEIEFINLYGRVDQKTGTLVNLTDGGDGCLSRIMKEETKKKIGNKHKGKKYTKEFKDKLSKIHKERLSIKENLQKHIECLQGHKKPYRTEEHRRKISENSKKRIYTEETRAKMSKAKCFGLLQYDLNGVFIKEWNSVLEAAKIHGDKKAIYLCCMNRRDSAYGYVWKYKRNLVGNRRKK